jgi:hypothetical protein
MFGVSFGATLCVVSEAGVILSVLLTKEVGAPPAPTTTATAKK